MELRLEEIQFYTLEKYIKKQKHQRFQRLPNTNTEKRIVKRKKQPKTNKHTDKYRNTQDKLKQQTIQTMRTHT